MTRFSTPDIELWTDDLLTTTNDPSSLTRGTPSCLTATVNAEGVHDSALFWHESAHALVARASGAPRSAVFGWYSLFHEFGERHVAGNGVAVVEYGAAKGFADESYASLVQSARVLAEAWRNAGLLPGELLCLTLDVNVTFFRCLLAGWYCGAVVSIVPPDGEQFVVRAVRALLADPKTQQPAKDARVFGAFGRKAERWVRGQDGVIPVPIHDDGGSSPTWSPHRYAAEEPAARLFSPLFSEWDAPVEVSAEQLYLGALRDALLLRLVGGEGVAAPGACNVSLKPSLMFATLASGASWVEVGLEEVGDASALFRGRVQLLVVSNELRSTLIGMPDVPKGKLSRWVHNVAEDDDFDAWSLLQSKLTQAGLLGMKLFANAAAGGIMLFSRWAASPLSQGLWPAPGLLCELTEPNGTHMPQLSDVGMLTPISAEHAPLGFALGLTEAAIGRIVVARVGVGYTWVTNLGSHWEGKVLPEAQIEKLLVDEFPRTARAAVLVVLPARQSSARERVQLIVFARPHSEEKLSASAVSVYLREALGHDWVPRDVRVFEVNPRLEDPHDPNGAIDRPACVAQYLSGTIWLKHRCGPVFRELARLSGQI